MNRYFSPGSQDVLVVLGVIIAYIIAGLYGI